MPGTELIMGMEEVVQHIRELEMREENLKEALAQKFFKHYDEMNYSKLNIARTVGPDLGKMIDHLMAENKRLIEENEDKDNTIASLEEEAEQNQQLFDTTFGEFMKLQEENKKLRVIIADEVARREKAEQSEKYARTTLSETIDELEKAKEIAYQFGIELFSDSEEEEEEEDVVFLYPNDEGTIQDPEHPEDYYSFGNNCKSKIGDNFTMKRILKNGSIKDCVSAYAYCMFVKGGKLYYRGRSPSGSAHVRTIKGEKTTMTFPY